MGKQRNSDNEEGMHSDSNKSETISLSSSVESPPRKKLKKRYKKSHKYKLDEVEAVEDENEYLERKKHKHKHKKHKREVSRHRSEHYEETESYRHHRHRRSHRSSSHKVRSRHRKHNNEVENRSRHSSHRKRSRYHDSEDRMRSDIKREDEDIEQQSSRWEDNEDTNSHQFPPIKTEPITESSEEEEEEEEEEAASNHDLNNRVKEERQHRERPQREEWGAEAVPVKEEEEEGANPEAKETINFGLSGKLTEDANTYNGVVVKYSQPPEARKPKRRWRWYIFKGDEELPFLPLHRQSAYLIGRERKVADIPTDHPSCSKQHAVFQYRLVSYERENGTVGRTVKPYILDLGSANGTYVNNRRIDPKRYVELMEKDVVKFGYSSREYVLLHEASKGSDTELPDAEPELSPVSLLRNH